MKYILSFVGVVAICLSVFLFKDNKKQEECLQINIIANSFSERDQIAKREVENAVVMFFQNKTKKAKNFSDKNLKSIENLAVYILRNNGFEYGCCVEIQTEVFPTDFFNNFVTEAGKYETLVIKLGNANGSNLWRVLSFE